MLIGIDPLLTPDLLHALASMGHGDEIAIVDANFPATSTARRLLALDGVDAPRALEAVLGVLPLDHMVAHPARVMAVVDKPDEVPPAVADFARVLQRRLGHTLKPHPVERHAFYGEAQRCFAILRTGERRFFGNIILTKGVVDPEGKVPPLPGGR
ncbi:MAG: ribose ABC transporter [Alphaproteobacteria bacterium]|nr:ribose ABC transporter [Alphaproteobacteria bacterium]